MPRTDKRKHARKVVSWPVHATGSGIYLIGAEVRDVSDTGVFLRPNATDKLPEIGTHLSLMFFPQGRWQGTGLSTNATVSWTGDSRTHHCAGVGLTLDDTQVGQELVSQAQVL